MTQIDKGGMNFQSNRSRLFRGWAVRLCGLLILRSIGESANEEKLHESDQSFQRYKLHDSDRMCHMQQADLWRNVRYEHTADNHYYLDLIDTGVIPNGSEAMDTYQVLSLMIAFGGLIALIMIGKK